MPQDYTVTSVAEKDRWTSSYGKDMVTYMLGLEEYEGKPAQHNRLATSAAPVVGDTIYGHLEPQGDYPAKLVKDQNPNAQGGGRAGGGGGGRGGGGYSPQDIAAMRRAGAQDRALKFMEVRGLVPFIDPNEEGAVEIRPPEGAVELERIIDWFEADVAEAVAKVPS